MYRTIVVRTFMYTFLYPYRLCTAEMLSEADMNDHIEQHMREKTRKWGGVKSADSSSNCEAIQNT